MTVYGTANYIRKLIVTTSPPPLILILIPIWRTVLKLGVTRFLLSLSENLHPNCVRLGLWSGSIQLAYSGNCLLLETDM